jgi:hypothetical protein
MDKSYIMMPVTQTEINMTYDDNDKVYIWYKKADEIQNNVSKLIRTMNSPKHSYLSDGKTVNVDYTPDERIAIYAQAAKSFEELRKEGDALLADLQKQKQSPDVTDSIEAVSGKLASFLTNNRLYDYSEGLDAQIKFRKIRAKYLEIYDRQKYMSGKAKLQEMITKKSGVVYTDPAKKDELKKQRAWTKERFDDMNEYAMITRMKRQND